MGKKRVQAQSRQTRQQVRQVRPKSVPVPPTGSRRRQQERYVSAGGLLQGYAPERVIQIGHFAAAGAVTCILIGLAIGLLLPYDVPVRIVAGAVWAVPIVFAGSFILPGYRLARQDRKLEPTLVQGQLLGASEVSTQLGLGMLMVKTRGSGTEQYLVEPAKLAKVPGNQVNVMLNVTPKLRHVLSVGIMGQRMMGRPEQPVPPVLRRLRLLPIASPIALSLAAIIGVDVVAAIPLYPGWAHALVAAAAGLALAGIVFGVSYLAQRRLVSQVQALVPGGLQ